jgi:GNAT-family acetyltransferase (TIGR03103 family)
MSKQHNEILATSTTDAKDKNVVLQCGWGRLLFTNTFTSAPLLAQTLSTEGLDQRDIALYVADPHVLLAAAPHELFLDPSHTFRLDFNDYCVATQPFSGFVIRSLKSASDADAVNRLYALHNMVQVWPEFMLQADPNVLTYLVAEDETTGAIIGTVMGVDHYHAFGDPERGSSLWCLAIDMQAVHMGVGEMLVRRLAQHYITLGLAYMDLSVLHDNSVAIALYRRLGFKRMPYFCVKRRNLINERLFVGPDPAKHMNPYARIIIDEARRRSIGVEVIDGEGGVFELSFGGRAIRCRESLSDLTTAVSLSICDDKALTRRVVAKVGISVPEQIDAADTAAVEDMLQRHGSVVVKPVRGEQGRGVAVDLRNMEDVQRATEFALQSCNRVIVESFHSGLDLRLVVIGFRLVAAAIRKPAQVIGDGQHSMRELIERHSRRRAAATGGESTIAIDPETERCVAAAGYALHDVPDKDVAVQVRKTANLHTGGTIHDVTEEVHPRLVEAAVSIARAIDIPVVGIDFIVNSPLEPEYVFIEANERPGLANHEPQPTAQRFVDMLFPLSMPISAREARSARRRSESASQD